MKITVPPRIYSENIVRVSAATFLSALILAGLQPIALTWIETLGFAALVVAINVLLMVAQDLLPVPNPGAGLPPQKGAPR